MMRAREARSRTPSATARHPFRRVIRPRYRPRKSACRQCLLSGSRAAANRACHGGWLSAQGVIFVCIFLVLFVLAFAFVWVVRRGYPMLLRGFRKVVSCADANLVHRHAHGWFLCYSRRGRSRFGRGGLGSPEKIFASAFERMRCLYVAPIFVHRAYAAVLPGESLPFLCEFILFIREPGFNKYVEISLSVWMHRVRRHAESRPLRPD
jgi:hypothetical protein